jgi:hypothetical protein
MQVLIGAMSVLNIAASLYLILSGGYVFTSLLLAANGAFMVIFLDKEFDYESFDD